MTAINKLSQCQRLNEFQTFIEQLEVDETSGGRKFVFAEKRTYTMNQIVDRFQACVKDSLPNEKLVSEIKQHIQCLDLDGSQHVSGCFYEIRKAIGNWWYSLTHSGFNKTEVLDTIFTIQGRQDSLEIDEEGNTPLHRALLTGKNEEELYRDVSELVACGCDLNHEEKSYFDLAYALAINGDVIPLTIMLSFADSDQLLALIRKYYSSSHAMDIKNLIAARVKEIFNSCIPVLQEFQDDVAREDFFHVFHQKFHSEQDSSIDFCYLDEHGNNIVHYGAMYLTTNAEITPLLRPNPQGGRSTWAVRNGADQLPQDLAQSDEIKKLLTAMQGLP